MKRILNFGSLNIDYVYLVDHFVRPGETMQSQGLSVFCGGKGLNQSIALARAGAAVFHAGCVGKDDGQILLTAMSEAGVNIENVRQIDTRSGNALIQVTGQGENAIILFGGANQCITEEHIEKALEKFNKNDILLLQNEINCTGLLIEKAAQIGMTVVLNPSPCDDRIRRLPLHLIDYFVLNEIEGADITRCNEKDGKYIANALYKTFPGAKIVLTLGKHGAIYFDGVNEYRHRAFDVPVIDTTAAGDTFTGFFLAGIAKGDPPHQIIEIASKASAIAVSTAGASASIPTIDFCLKWRGAISDSHGRGRF